ncbi:laccase precursor [Polyplosphaeria fusca]|uniref:laccase n=1 Tax=Polyplosphaeria fusca TaxID=682080 RepID=A0A9P4RB40_9PLEO|nr:laccase precursor [Polyplosphaeria fusca]
MRLNDVFGLAVFATAAVAEHIPFDHILWGTQGPAGNHLEKRATSTSSTSTRVPDAVCTNSPSSRNCWSAGYSVATDFDKKWPSIGVTTRYYNWEITNGTCNPDGGPSKQCQLINGKYPGPVLSANWGDTVVVTLKNSLTANGTGIHWHGIRQLNTVLQDGVPGITECPLAPGDTKTYTWKATQFGSTWYHSHWSAQYGDGVFGPIVINGPASANYDIDLGPLTVNDWYYKTSYQMALIAHNNLQARTPPPPADNLLVNGTGKSANGGSYWNVPNLVPGKKYRLRLINTATDNSIRVSLDNHPFLVINADLVPIQPYTTNWVLLTTGQRYDVVFTANQTAGNYWFRAQVANDCASANNGVGRAIFSYQGVAAADPTSTAAAVTVGPGFSTCRDPNNLTPWVVNTVDSQTFLNQVTNLEVNLAVQNVTTNGQNIVVWAVNLTGIDVAWDKPTAKYVKSGDTNYPRVLNLIEIPNENTWSYWIIQETANSPVPIPHPIHLHGHDFYVLGSGVGTFDKNSSPAGMTFNNPIRRDTAILPGNGWLALAFPSDNPGAWLMHCHIAWHVSDGLAVQFLESKSTMPLPDQSWEDTCSRWYTYQQTMPYPKSDSGLRLM